MRKIRQSPGRSEKIFRDEDKGIYVTEYFERTARRGLTDILEFSARWKDLGYVSVPLNGWARIFSSLSDLWTTSNRKSKADISLRIGRPESLNAACYNAQALTDPADILAAMKFCIIAADKKLTALFETLEKNILPHLHRLSPDQCAELLKTYAAKDVYPPARLISNLDKRPPHFHAQMEPEKFYMFVRAQSTLGVKLAGLNESLAEGIDVHATNLPAQRHEPLLWSFAVLHSLAPSGAVADAAREFFTYANIKPSAIKNLVCQWFDIPASISGVKFTNDPSSPEKRLLHLFSTAGGKILPPVHKATGKFMPPADARVHFNAASLVFEYDGVETHMTKDTDGRLHYNGSTLFNSALMTKCEKDTILVRIDSRNYDSLVRLPADDKSLIRELLIAAAALEPGAYAARIGERVKLAPLI